jgi:two-component system response regulator MtrA
MANTRPRILVVEDDPDLLRMLDLALRSIGDVTTALDGLDALEKARAIAPEIVVTDVMMPGMDGLELSRRLKKELGLVHVPIVLLTAKTGPKDVIAGINAGARFYVTKPFKTEDLIAKVKKALNRA